VSVFALIYGWTRITEYQNHTNPISDKMAIRSKMI
jgi:hypothetical protein